MKTPGILSLIILLSFFNTANAQGEFVVEIDTSNGSVIKLGSTPIPGITWIYPGVRTYDEINGQFIFYGYTTLPGNLYFIDVTTGAPVTNPVFPASGGPSEVREPQYDNSTATLYGLHWDTSAQAFFLSTIDRTTGLHTHVGSLPITTLNGTGQGTTTFDQHHHRYIHFVNKQLISIDATTGALLTDQMLNIPQTSNMISICYDHGTDTLFGLRQVNDTPQRFVACFIDMATGTVTDIGSGTTFGKGNGSGTIDTTSHRYLYQYSIGHDYYIGGLDLSSGNLVFHQQLTLDSGENVFSIVFDHTRQKLFAIHWNYNIEPSGLTAANSENVSRIYPVPARQKVNVWLDKKYTSVTLYNMTGQVVRLVNSTGIYELSIDISNLASGLYVLECVGQDGSMKGKILVK